MTGTRTKFPFMGTHSANENPGITFPKTSVICRRGGQSIAMGSRRGDGEGEYKERGDGRGYTSTMMLPNTLVSMFN